MSKNIGAIIQNYPYIKLTGCMSMKDINFH